MYSSQPSAAQITDAIKDLAGSDDDRASRAYNLFKTIDGTNLELLPLLMEGLTPQANGDLFVSCALALSRYGDKAQSCMDTIAKLLIPECQLDLSAANALIYAISNIHCSRSVEIFRELLKSEDPALLHCVVGSFKRLGELARELIPTLRQIEKKGEMLEGEISYQLQEFYSENAGLDFEDLLEGRHEFVAVPLHCGDSEYSPESYHIRDLDVSRQGLLYDEMFDFRYGNASGMCRLRIAKDGAGETCVVFSYDRRSSGVSIQNVIEHLASTTRLLFPDLPDNVKWYEHWCPSSGVVAHIELKRVEFKFRPEVNHYYNPKWLTVDAPESVIGRYGIDLTEFSDPR